MTSAPIESQAEPPLSPVTELPFARGLPIFGHAGQRARDPLELVARLAREHNGAVRFRILKNEVIAVDDPGLARHVLQEKVDIYPRSFHYRNGSTVLGDALLTQEGPSWHRARRMMQPAFRSDPVREVATVTARCWTRVRDRWYDCASRGETIDARVDLQRLALDGITTALCGVEPELEAADRFGELVRRALREVRKLNTAIVRLPPWARSRQRATLAKICRAFEDFLGPIVDARMQNPEGRDILSALVRARDESGALRRRL
jgi:cytochrome P450